MCITSKEKLARASYEFVQSLDGIQVDDLARDLYGEGFKEEEYFFPVNEYEERSVNSDAIDRFVVRCMIDSYGDPDGEEAKEFVSEMAEANEWEGDWEVRNDG